ncbi:hypothetical protein Kfla_3155 [Kribbella flavida DSM 17836]|uniref:Uncharacterized protein n=1 Tax=Kribbella flavida (strain DSM 17836 / JCM 10339 / NBRC 14399) TaxID=479435 RepID=D2Q393_KRIFD|nr:hypothetical protein Kfla_3155 [Kribbella flavida DSM 17836]
MELGGAASMAKAEGVRTRASGAETAGPEGEAPEAALEAAGWAPEGGAKPGPGEGEVSEPTG